MATSTHESVAMDSKVNSERIKLNIAANQWAKENPERIKELKKNIAVGYYVDEDGNPA
ncbi:MAG: hypothetical protein K6G49_02375 [Candidatus Saccharibacteria bacterium]|nr:hypothetical protein [Candidatus Saccharibacteria bacterium]